uniref:Uncharacterized protein n=1 Tax=Graphocephala atropunctata TaxID=36148 RepID=A0A1B6KV42_9HEMI
MPNELTPSDYMDTYKAEQQGVNGGVNVAKVKQEFTDPDEPSTPAADTDRKRKASRTPQTEEQETSPPLTSEKKKKKKKRKKHDEEAPEDDPKTNIKEEPVDPEDDSFREVEAVGEGEEPRKEKKKKKKKDKKKEMEDLS